MSTSQQELADAASSKVREFRSHVEPVIDRFATRVQEIAERSLSTASGMSSRAQRQIGDYAGATSRYVSEEPVRAILIAAAAGAVLAGLILAARNYRNRY